MPLPPAPPLRLRPGDRRRMEAVIRKRTAPQRAVFRARIILLCAEGLPHRHIKRARKAIGSRRRGSVIGNPTKRGATFTKYEYIKTNFCSTPAFSQQRQAAESKQAECTRVGDGSQETCGTRYEQTHCRYRKKVTCRAKRRFPSRTSQGVIRFLPG